MWQAMKGLVLLAVVAAVALAAVPRASPQGGGATQLVVSGQTPRPSTSTGTLGDFGIWVWCEDPDAGNNYAGACAGSLYFYDLALTKAVFGTLTVLDEGVSFSMDLTSRDLVSVACTVSGELADLKPGPRNTVHVACSPPVGGREGDLINTVVVVTHGA